jgi:hypothetical protein
MYLFDVNRVLSNFGYTKLHHVHLLYMCKLYHGYFYIKIYINNLQPIFSSPLKILLFVLTLFYLKLRKNNNNKKFLYVILY